MHNILLKYTFDTSDKLKGVLQAESFKHLDCCYFIIKKGETFLFSQT